MLEKKTEQGTKIEPVNFIKFLRSVVQTMDDFDEICLKIQEVFVQSNQFRAVIISGPACSGKTILFRLFQEIIDYLTPSTINPQFAIIEILESSLFNKTDNVQLIKIKRPSAKRDPFVLQSLITEIPVIVNWLKDRRL